MENRKARTVRGAVVLRAALLALAACAPIPLLAKAPRGPVVLDPGRFKHYIDRFNKHDNETITNFIPNRDAWEWLVKNIPLFECPDKELEEIYYFRWWTYRKHIKKTPDGFVVTEFLPPVPWAKKHNTINCPSAHHIYEGRWLRNREYLDQYSLFWFRGGGEARQYSFWAADSIYARYLADGNRVFALNLLPDLVQNYQGWEKSHQDANGLFWQRDAYDGMEKSIGGHGYRATINSYMYGDAVAIAKLAEMAGNSELTREYRGKAEKMKSLVETKLWDDQAKFFKVLPRGEGEQLADVRELHGYVPWYFNLPGYQYTAAWKQLMDPGGFFAPYGPMTAERRHPRFMFQDQHECLWNGPTWPFATTQALVALANVLNNYTQDVVSKADYLKLLKIYARSQHRRLPDGTVVPWIDENLDPFTGEWLAGSILRKLNRPDRDRGKDYNHSGFADLVITGLVGLRPKPGDSIEVNPLVPEGTWPYFSVDNVPYHGHSIAIVYDKTGERYHQGGGLRIFADGKKIGEAESLRRLMVKLPSAGRSGRALPPDTAAGWRKHDQNPVLGGKLGTCFDVSVMKEGGRYRMWFSWRPKASVGLVESKDGVHWSEPIIVLGPNPETNWEEKINRIVVLRRLDGYHMWYTGQSRARSWIGYATSPDGKVWKRMSREPVLSSDQPWEKVAVMCPHVIWDEKLKLYRMWYSGGEQYEPDAIGYATSPDGLRWTKWPANPVFAADPRQPWEQRKVTAGQVVYRDGWYHLFYIGFHDVDHAQIGVARSRDGVGNWQRHAANPFIRPGEGAWDHDACYKPFAILDGKRWMLWYNGRGGNVEQIGLAIHEGAALGF